MCVRMLLSALLLGSLWIPAAQAQSELHPRIALAAPFIDANTAGMVHVDLRGLDIPTAAERFLKLAPPGSDGIVKQVNLFVPVVNAAKSQLVEAGATDFFVMMITNEAAEEKPGFGVILVEKGKDPEGVITTIKNLPGGDDANVEMIVHQGAVIVGQPGVKELVESVKPGRAAEYSYCMKLAGNTDFQFILLPTPALLDKVAKQPAAAGAGPAAEAAKEWVGKVRAVVFTANLPPKSALALFVKMKDEATATEAMEQIKAGLESDGAKQARTNPIIAKLIPVLTPKQDKELLKVVLTDANGGTDTMAESVKQGLAMVAQFFAMGGGLPMLPGQ